jgi:hypothetical protein
MNMLSRRFDRWGIGMGEPFSGTKKSHEANGFTSWDEFMWFYVDAD